MKRVLLIAGVSLLLLIAGGAYLLATESGLRVLASVFLPDSITVGAIRGRAIGPVHIENLELRQPGLSARAEQVELDWGLIGGLAGHLHIEPLEIDALEIKLEETDKPSGDPVTLPLALSIPDATVRDLIMRSGESEWRAEELALALSIDSERIAIERVVLTAGELEISGAGQADVAIPHAVDVEVDWEWAPPDRPTAAGTARIAGTLEYLEIAHVSSSPFEWSASGTVFDLIDQPSWQLTVDVPEFDPSTVSSAWPATRLGTRIELDGSEAGVEIRGTLRFPEWTTRTLTLHGLLDWSGDDLDIESLEVGVQDSPLRVAVAGRIGWTPTLEYDLTGEWEAIAWSVTRVAEMESPEGRFDVAGSLSEYRGSLDGRVSGPVGGGRSLQGDLSATFTGDASQAQSDDVRIIIGDGQVGGTASVDWREEPSFVANLRGKQFDPGLFLAELSGATNFDLAVQANWTERGPRYRISLESLAGVVNGQTVAGRASVESLDPGGASSDIDLRVGDGTLRASGLVGPELDMTWELDAPDVSSFVPRASGQLRSRGRLTGKRAEPRVDLSAQGSNLGWMQVRVGKLETQIRFDIATGELGDTRTRLDDVLWRGLELEQVVASVDGSVASHEITAELTAPDGVAQLRAEGGYREPQWTGQLTSLTSDSDLIGRWELEAPVSIEVGAGGFSAERACFGYPPARLCAAGAWSNKRPWWFEADLDRVELSRLKPLLPQDFDYTGQLTAEGEFKGGRDLPLVGRAAVNLEAATLTLAGQDHAIASLKSGTARLSADPDVFALDVDLDLTPQGELEAQLRAGRTGPDAAVAGYIRGSLSGLEFLTLLFPELLDVTGELVVDLELDGTVGAPAYGGQVSLIDGTASVVTAGITIEDIALEIDGDKGAVNVSGAARSGEGQVNLSGSARWSDGEPRGHFVLDGERFRFVGLPGARVDASPELELIIVGRNIDLTGEVRIDSARIEPIDLTLAVTTSPDEIIVGETPPEPERWQVSSRIAVMLGEDITIDAYGVKGSIRGSLEIVDLPGRPAGGTGEVAIEDGFFKAYGQSLDIERGRLSFGGGPLNNPTLDVRAVRRFETATAGVEVRGPLRDPQITVFSDPPRPRQYALAMLVMGAAPVELGRASDALAFGSPSEQLDQSFGLGGASGGLGTYLSPDYYMAYLEQINLRWRVSRKWTVEISRGLETSVGVVYSAR